MRGLVSAMVLSPLYRTKFRVFTGKADCWGWFREAGLSVPGKDM
jgi:hypothetical protein